MHILRSGLCIALLAASTTVIANDQPEARGSCTITVPSMTPACINYITHEACQERAQSNAGAAQWTENSACPTPQEVVESRGDPPISYPE